MIRKVLIANRGEIAVRILRAARELGIRTVVPYGDPDRDSIATMMADEAVAIGGSEPGETYLDIGKMLAAAEASGADAIHPGYGFLAERASFSQACADAGLTFIGPPASAMKRLGSKAESKALAEEAGVPMAPSYFKVGASPSDLKEAAGRIGYPIMLKASAGGGGRGMRAVRRAADFEDELRTASDEALKAFGDGTMLVEKLIERPRHVEAQFLADTHGNLRVLFERECSLQRRHQKLIEEAPAERVFDGSFWDRLREVVARLVAASGYVNAGTAEFLVDEAAGEFYFMEVNARLQVEHPVTEAVTGIDLVEWQFRIAAGERIDFDLAPPTGHAIEARIIAEDPSNGFLPSIGKLLAWAEPKGPGIRVDAGYGPGSEVSRNYDSLLAKVVAHGETRSGAVRRLIAALEDFHILGVKTNIEFLLDVLRHPAFESGQFDTGFLEREFSGWRGAAEIPGEIGAIVSAVKGGVARTADSDVGSGAWGQSDAFRAARSNP